MQLKSHENAQSARKGVSWCKWCECTVSFRRTTAAGDVREVGWLFFLTLHWDHLVVGRWRCGSLYSGQSWQVTTLAGVAQWIDCWPVNKGSPVQFPVRTHALVAGKVHKWGHTRGSHTLLFLSLSISLPSPLSRNKKERKVDRWLKSNHYKGRHQVLIFSHFTVKAQREGRNGWTRLYLKQKISVHSFTKA